MRYAGPVYRPPSEADSLLLQVTLGCSHNECTYCAMYRHKTFQARPLADVLADVEEARRLAPDTRRVFLMDGDAMTLSTARLVPVLEALNAAFPALQRVGSYVNAVSVLRKPDAELARLRDLKLTIGYLGLETGDPATAARIVKGATVDEEVEAVRRAQAAGIKMSVMVLLGIGGRARWREHAEATADALTRMDPRYVSCLCVTPVPGTPFFDEVARGDVELPSPDETLDELRVLVDRMRLTGAVFRSNHASNYLPLGGRLPADRARLLAVIDAARRGDVPLVPEEYRGL
ncbi:MAG: radical SAM protein [Planctomycetia bacterium]|nr:radical SAM protein [Planctomycetia bacterium]